MSVWNAILNFQTRIIRGKNKTKQNHKQTNKWKTTITISALAFAETWELLTTAPTAVWSSCQCADGPLALMLWSLLCALCTILSSVGLPSIATRACCVQVVPWPDNWWASVFTHRRLVLARKYWWFCPHHAQAPPGFAYRFVWVKDLSGYLALRMNHWRNVCLAKHYSQRIEMYEYPMLGILSNKYQDTLHSF